MAKPTAPRPGNQPLPAVHALGHPSSPPPRTAWTASARAQVAHGHLTPRATGPRVTGHDVADGIHAGAPANGTAPAAPAAPDAPVVVPGGATSLAVSWTPPATDAAHGAATAYTLRYSLAGASVWTEMTAVSSIYTLGGLAASTAYDVQVQASNANGTGGWSGSTTRTTASLAPNAPAAPSVTSSGTSALSVSWAAPAADAAHGAATGYSLRHSLSGAGNWTIVPGVSSPYTLSGLAAAAAYDVQVQAANATGASAWSATGSAATAATAPNAPAIASVVAPPDGTVSKLTVAWSTPSPDASHSVATGFDLRHGPAGSGTWTTITGVTSPFTITGLAGATSFDVQVRATNTGGGPSAWSPAATGQTWGATVVQGPWIIASTQTHGTGVAPNGGAQLFAVAAPTAVTGAAFAWSASSTAIPTSGLFAGGYDNLPNGWGQWLGAPATAGTWYFWMLAQGAGGATIGALVYGPITVN